MRRRRDMGELSIFINFLAFFFCTSFSPFSLSRALCLACLCLSVCGHKRPMALSAEFKCMCAKYERGLRELRELNYSKAVYWLKQQTGQSTKQPPTTHTAWHRFNRERRALLAHHHGALSGALHTFPLVSSVHFASRMSASASEMAPMRHSMPRARPSGATKGSRPLQCSSGKPGALKRVRRAGSVWLPLPCCRLVSRYAKRRVCFVTKASTGSLVSGGVLHL